MLDIAIRNPMDRNPRIQYSTTPFIRITIPLALGIGCDLFIEAHSTYWLILLLIASTKTFVLWMLPLKWRWKLRLLQGITIMLLIFIFGGVAHSFKIKELNTHSNKTEKVYFLKIIEKNRKTNTGRRYLAEIYQLNEPYEYVTNCYIYTKDSLLLFKEGDIIISNSKLDQINNTSNPGGYDFQKKSAMNGVFMKTYIKDQNECSLIGFDKNMFRQLINNNQAWILETLRQSLNNKKNSGLAEAIMIGHRDDLDPSLLDSYTNTGVVHVIAISGLHIGLIFSIISMIINATIGQAKGKWTSFFITLPLIWWFTILTGSTPSVIRSALMSTCIIIGNASDRKAVALNSLMAAAFIQLLYNPNIINDLGFQLSYTAVGSILIFNPFISKLLYVNNKLIKSCWDMICVTIAAQLLTTPISIYHFHQFPLLFLFTNIVAVPLSSLILIAEILLCLTHLIKLKTDILSISINFLVDAMNAYIGKIETVPFAVINDLLIGIPTLVMLYFIFISLFFLIRDKKPISVLYLLFALGTTSIVHHTHKILKSFERRIVILNVSQQTLLMIQDGQHAMMISTKKFLENYHGIAILKKQLASKYWIKNIEYMSIPPIPSMIKLNNSEFLIDKRKSIERILLISGNPTLELIEYATPADSSTLLVADASNKLWKILEWETEADKLLLPFHAVPKMGPLILESQHSVFSALKN